MGGSWRAGEGDLDGFLAAIGSVGDGEVAGEGRREGRGEVAGVDRGTAPRFQNFQPDIWLAAV